MKLARRGFLQALGAGALGARQAAEATAKQLGGISSVGSRGPALVARFGSADQAPQTSGPSSGWNLTQEAKRAALRAVLADKHNRGEIESILYRWQRQVHSLDADLAANRSYSLAAKICYQRQRNVEYALLAEVLEEDSVYQQARNWVAKALSLGGVRLG